MNSKDELLTLMTTVTGTLPAGAREVLSLLVRPDMIEATKRYIWIAEEKRGQCEACITLFDRSLVCTEPFDHDGDHKIKTECDYDDSPVVISWAKKSSPACL